MPKAIKSQGVKLYYSDGGSPSVFAAVGNITNFSGPSGSAAIIDQSNLDSTFVEKMMGLPDEGQLSFAVNLDPDNTSHLALKNARKNGTLVEFKITLTDSTPTNLLFFGYVTGFSIAGAVNEKVTAQITIEIDGEVVWS